MNQDKRSRRDFLKAGAAAATLGIAVPCFFASCSRPKPRPPSETLAVASIGVGGRGTDIGQEAAKLGKVVACADVDLGHAKKFAAAIGGGCQVYQDYRRVLDREDVDAVLIATPDHWHVKIAIDAMRAGKDVYCEKPVTLTIAEGRLICKVVKETGRIVQAGTQQRSDYNQLFLKAVAIARSGRLGKKLAATVTVDGAMSGGPFATQVPPPDFDWDMWLGQAPQVAYCPERGDWRFRYWFDYCGGEVTTWGVHHVDIAVWALGGEDTGAVEVEGNGQYPLGRQKTLDYMLGKVPIGDLPNSFNVPSTYECTMRLPNGNEIVLSSSSLTRDIFISGELGHLAVNRGGIHGKFYDELVKDPKNRQWLSGEMAKLYRGRPIRETTAHMADFFDCVKDRALPISDVFTHCNSVNACHMANIAMLVGRKVTWDRKKEEFVGDEEANRLTHRTQREPYAIKA